MKKNSDLKKKRLAVIRQSKRYLGVKNLKSKEDRLKVYKEAARAAAMAQAEADRVDFIETFYKLTPAQKRILKNLRAQDKKMRADALELGRIFAEEEVKLEKQKKERGRKTKTFQQRLEELKQELPTLSPEAQRVRIHRLKKIMLAETPQISAAADLILDRYLLKSGIREKSQTRRERERREKRKEEKERKRREVEEKRYQEWLKTPEGKEYLRQQKLKDKREKEIERERKKTQKKLDRMAKQEEKKRREKK